MKLGLFLTIPYGILADKKKNQKFILILAMIGVILCQIWTMTVCWFWHILPLRLIWISPLFQVIGGGGNVAYVMAYAIISDVSAEADR